MKSIVSAWISSSKPWKVNKFSLAQCHHPLSRISTCHADVLSLENVVTMTISIPYVSAFLWTWFQECVDIDTLECSGKKSHCRSL